MSLPDNLLTTTQAHLDLLISDRIREGPHLDFKRELPKTWNEGAKHELLADATAFANTGGGDLIFGVDEDGQAQAAVLIPQAVANPDQEVRRLQDFLLNLAEPRMPGVQVHVVPIAVNDTEGFVIIVRVPQSWAGPHRVKTNQHFFIRDGLRKRQLDVPEIRSLFLRSENQAHQVRNFRTERLSKILSGEAPHKLVDGSVLVVHLIPTQAALGLVQVSPIQFTNERALPVLGAAGEMARLNLDGALAVRNERPDGFTHGYSLFFRNGFFEATQVLAYNNALAKSTLPSLRYEVHLIALLRNFRAELELLGLNVECAVMLSLLRADEVQLGVRDEWGEFAPHQTLFDRRTLILPDVLARSDATPESALKPAFDLMWQAAGFPGSRNYNEAGEWAP